MLYWVFRFICWLVVGPVCRIKAYGKENLPEKGGFILASNHVSNLDPVALGVACPRALNYMAKHELFSNPLASWVLYHSNAFPLKRDTADLSAIKEAIRRVKAGSGLLLFPQGTRVADLDDRTPQPGVGFLAAKLDAPVIPAFVKGTSDALPKGAKFIRPKKISIYFGPQISVERGLPYEQIASMVMDNIRRLAC